jgi:hypothetical protein
MLIKPDGSLHLYGVDRRSMARYGWLMFIFGFGSLSASDVDLRLWLALTY